MSRTVYAWPPVGVVGAEWTVEAPVGRSRSLITGREFVSAAQRRRRVVRLDVSALAAGRSGGGYMEVLKDLLDGGVNLVRLHSTPVNWHLDAAREAAFRQSGPLSWETGDGPLSWETGDGALGWYSGTWLQGALGTDAAGFPVLTVTGLPASRLVARPGEYITVYQPASSPTGEVARVLTEAHSGPGGTAVIRIYQSEITGGGRVTIGDSVSGIFAPRAIPRAVQPVGADWRYAWEFEERFADELGTLVEVDPW